MQKPKAKRMQAMEKKGKEKSRINILLIDKGNFIKNSEHKTK